MSLDESENMQRFTFSRDNKVFRARRKDIPHGTEETGIKEDMRSLQ